MFDRASSMKKKTPEKSHPPAPVPQPDWRGSGGLGMVWGWGWEWVSECQRFSVWSVTNCQQSFLRTFYCGIQMEHQGSHAAAAMLSAVPSPSCLSGNHETVSLFFSFFSFLFPRRPPASAPTGGLLRVRSERTCEWVRDTRSRFLCWPFWGGAIALACRRGACPHH